jgi:hypothetical protein
MTLDRRDFDEWWQRECARSSIGDPGPAARHWAEFGFFAAQTLIRAQVRTQNATMRSAQRPAALLMRDMLKAADK